MILCELNYLNVCFYENFLLFDCLFVYIVSVNITKSGYWLCVDRKMVLALCFGRESEFQRKNVVPFFWITTKRGKKCKSCLLTFLLSAVY